MYIDERRLNKMNCKDEKELRNFVENLSTDKLYSLHEILIDEMNTRKDLYGDGFIQK